MLRERREVLHRALDELPDRERDAVIMRMIQGRDTAEIAEAMGVSRPDRTIAGCAWHRKCCAGWSRFAIWSWTGCTRQPVE